MRLEGTLSREGRWWIAEVPLLDAMTQGRSRREALRMAADLVTTLADRPGFAARADGVDDLTFEVSANDVGVLVALVLRRARVRSGLTLAEVAGRLGSSSVNSYARYEQGRAAPTVGKLCELLRAVGLEPVLGSSRRPC